MLPTIDGSFRMYRLTDGTCDKSDLLNFVKRDPCLSVSLCLCLCLSVSLCAPPLPLSLSLKLLARVYKCLEQSVVP